MNSKEKLGDLEAERQAEIGLASSLRRQVEILISNPRHPSLGVKKIKGTKSIFGARVDDHFRFTFEFGEKNEVIFRVVGPHNAALKKP